MLPAPLSQPWLPSLQGWRVGAAVGDLVVGAFVGALHARQVHDAWESEKEKQTRPLTRLQGGPPTRLQRGPLTRLHHWV